MIIFEEINIINFPLASFLQEGIELGDVISLMDWFLGWIYATFLLNDNRVFIIGFKLKIAGVPMLKHLNYPLGLSVSLEIITIQNTPIE